MENNQDNFKSSWNMQSLLTLGSYQERKEANLSFVKGDYSKAFRHLMALKGMLIGIISAAERDALEKIEANFLTAETAMLSLKSRSSFDSDVKANKFMVRRRLHTLYNSYNNLLMDLLQEKDLLINAKVDETTLTL